jgi:GTP-binding protein
VATTESATLLDFRYRPRYKAGDGRPGSGQRRTGADGDDLFIPVPCGTLVIRQADGEVLGDLVDPDQRLLVARGGRGGSGNWVFRSARDQAPRKSTPGRPGEELEIRLELKLIADVGLVGAPNAGKSTLLSVLTAARPKIAAYEFTTLVPNLGIVDLGDYSGCTLADIPGLIEGAATGRGLGHEFLRHVERTRALLLLVDGSVEDPAHALDMLRAELTEYGHRLARRPFAVVVTKSDLLDARAAAEIHQLAADWGVANEAEATLLISAVAAEGLDELRRLLGRLMQVSAREEPGEEISRRDESESADGPPVS